MARIPEECTSRTSDAFRKRFLFLLFEKDLSKAQFAEKAGVNKEVVSRAADFAIIPSVRSLIKFADAFEVSLPYLLAETDTDEFFPAESASSFYERLNLLLEKSGQTYSSFAAKMPFQKNSYYEWKRKHSLPCLDYLKAISQYFGVGIDYLLGRTDYEN